MKNTSPLISVIIPIYNRMEVITECINSVLQQSYSNFEIIIVDDGSTDDTYNICKNIAANDKRIKLFKGEHKGVSFARNLALDNAIGEFIFFLDSDDVIHHKLFEVLISNIKNDNIRIAATGDIRISPRKWAKVADAISNSSTTGNIVYYKNEDAIDFLIKGGSPLSGIGGVMMQKNLIGNTRFRTDLFLGEDFYFNYENLVKGCDCIFLEQKWYFYRQDDKNSSRNRSSAALESQLKMRKLIYSNEENLKRQKNADIQKQKAFTDFMLWVYQGQFTKQNIKIFKGILKAYKKDFFKVISFKSKLFCLGFSIFPSLSTFIAKKITNN